MPRFLISFHPSYHAKIYLLPGANPGGAPCPGNPGGGKPPNAGGGPNVVSIRDFDHVQFLSYLLFLQILVVGHLGNLQTVVLQFQRQVPIRELAYIENILP